MTVANDDFIPVEESQEEAAPAYPTAFGITFTPVISGILLAVLGLAGTLYILLNLVMPSWEKNQEQQANLQQKQEQVRQKQANLKQSEKIKADLAQAKQQRTEVYALFANEKNLDTLLLDLNQQVVSGNTQLGRNATRAELVKFVPVNQSAEVVTDGSLGAEVNGKLKRRTINVQVDGTFEQTQSIIRRIERLQPLLLIKEYQSTLAPAPVAPPGTVPQGGPPTISTAFQLQALVPATPEETAAATVKK